jgi:hypothetical protein
MQEQRQQQQQAGVVGAGRTVAAVPQGLWGWLCPPLGFTWALRLIQCIHLGRVCLWQTCAEGKNRDQATATEKDRVLQSECVLHREGDKGAVIADQS